MRTRPAVAVGFVVLLVLSGCLGLGSGSGSESTAAPGTTGATPAGETLPQDTLQVTFKNAEGERTRTAAAFEVAVVANTSLAGTDKDGPGDPYVVVEVEGRTLARTDRLDRSPRTEVSLRLGENRLSEFPTGTLSVTVSLMDKDQIRNERVTAWSGSIEYDPDTGETFTITTTTPTTTATTTSPPPTTTPPPRDRLNRSVTVVRVVDSDSMVVRYPNGSTDEIRLLGVDAPEEDDVTPGEFQGIPDTEAGREWLRAWEENGTRWARNRLAGEEVRIVTDPAADRRGDFGRLLVYLYHDGELYNRQLLQRGYARLFESEFSKLEAFRRYERNAYLNGTGLWGFGESRLEP